MKLVIGAVIGLIALAFATIFPNPLNVTITSLVIVATLVWLYISMPRRTTLQDGLLVASPTPGLPEHDPNSPAIPDDYEWRKEALFIVGGGNAADNLLWRKERVTVKHDGVSQSRRSRETTTLRWQDFEDRAINHLLHAAATGFVLYPVNAPGDLNTAFSGWRQPASGKEGVDVDPKMGGRIWFDPHLAALAGPINSQERMKLREREVQQAIAQMETLENVLCVVHIVSASLTSSSFFKEIDIQRAMQTLGYQYDVIFYIEGPVIQGREPYIREALQVGIDRFKSNIKSPGQYVPIIATDNVNRPDEKLDHMGIILMLAGACASRADFGDPYKPAAIANVYAPFIPVSKKNNLLQQQASVNFWAEEFTSLDPDRWDCLWSGFDKKVPPSDRGDILVLMAGDQEICSNVFKRVQVALKNKGVSAQACVAHVPGAQVTWMAGLVPLTKAEVKMSIMEPVFAPLCK